MKLYFETPQEVMNFEEALRRMGFDVVDHTDDEGAHYDQGTPIPWDGIEETTYGRGYELITIVTERHGTGQVCNRYDTACYSRKEEDTVNEAINYWDSDEEE